MQLQSKFLQHAVETVLTFLYPAQCRACDKSLGLEAVPYICDACWHDIQFIEPPWCEICGTPNPENICDPCATNPPRYGKLRTIAFYETALQQAIHLFKFEKRKTLAKPLTQLILAHMPNDCRIEKCDFILPIPIHKKRLRERGFNQATLLAKGIAKATGVPIATDVLFRHRYTAAQSGLDREARQTNIIDAFQLRKKEVICGKHLLLIDDVFTTGATIREAVKVLWRADPAEIDVLTLARTWHA